MCIILEQRSRVPPFFNYALLKLLIDGRKMIGLKFKPIIVRALLLTQTELSHAHNIRG